MHSALHTDINILVVEQSVAIDETLVSLLRADFSCESVSTVDDAYETLGMRNHHVVLCDLSPTGTVRFDVIEKFKELSPYSEIVMLGGELSPADTVKAFRTGVFDILLIPARYEEVESVLERAIESAEKKRHVVHYRSRLETIAAERADEVDKALEKVESSYRVTLKALVQALETRDFETHGHSERVVTFSLRLGRELGLDGDALRDLELGALLHDIGKIGVPDAILRKPAKLNEEEWVMMKLHPIHGEKILRNIPFLEGASRVVSQHHEFWDGTGYPNGLRGDAVDIGARIFAVIDAFDAITSDRVYRAGRSYEEAVREIERCTGSQFDPAIVDAFKAIPKEDWDFLRERSLREKTDIASFQSVVDELLRMKVPAEFVN
jgi:response regulator RpfG family c-di-GMP phosphodiesterase